MMVLRAEDFSKFLSQLKDRPETFQQIIVPYKPESGPWMFKDFQNIQADHIELNSYRTTMPVKFLFYFPRENVYPVSSSFPKRLIAGLKACDLKALEVLDAALLNGSFREPVYSAWRENTTIISGDCSEICDSCSCNIFGGKPYPEKGFDLNISKLNGNVLLTVGSQKGEDLLQMISAGTECREALPYDKEIMFRQRNDVLSLLENQNSSNRHDKNYSELRRKEKSGWDLESKECIGCGACTNACPTCYCLILNDESEAEKFIKSRTYDSCQWYGYARVAGGGTPRPKMHERFRNRYLCKLDFMKSNFNMSGCTGCGRCTEVCAAQIDFRKVVRDLSSKPFQKISETVGS